MPPDAAPADPPPTRPRSRLLRLLRRLRVGAAPGGPSPKTIEGGLLKRIAARALAATVPTNRSGNNASVR